MEAFLSFYKSQIPLGYQVLTQTLQALPDSPSYQSLYEQLSNHPSSQIRAVIASKENLSEATIIQLAQDSSVSVLRSLVYNATAQSFLDTKLVIDITNRDPEAAENIAYNFERWNGKKELLKVLSKHSDPVVRNALANNSDTPKPIYLELVNDKDAGVVEAANRVLN